MDSHFRRNDPNKNRRRLNAPRVSLSKAARDRRVKQRRMLVGEQLNSVADDHNAESIATETTNSTVDYYNSAAESCTDNLFDDATDGSQEMDFSGCCSEEEIPGVEETLRNLNMDPETTSKEPDQDREAEKTSCPVITRGSFHQGDCRFPGYARGRQCTANAAAAIAMCKIKEPKFWQPETVDYVLMAGDNLYVDSMATRRDVHPDEAHAEFLTATELSKNIYVGAEKCILLVEGWLCGHLDNDFPQDGFPNLKNRLHDFLAGERYGILTCNSISVAVFRIGNTVWMFDSHSRNSAGEVTPDGRACLMGFPDVESMYNLLRKNIPSGIPGDDFSNAYDLTEITIQRQCEDEQLSEQAEVISNPPSAPESEIDVLEENCLEEWLHTEEDTIGDRNHEIESENMVGEERLIEEHELEVSHAQLNEGLQDINTLERGVYSFGHVWNKLHEAFDQHGEPFGCTFSNLRFIGYHRSGLKTLLKFKCSMCSLEKSIASEPENDRVLDINKAAVLGSICSGIGHSQLEQVLAAMDIKCMAASTFRHHEDYVYDGIAETAAAEMKIAGDEERDLAIQRGNIINGIPHIPVVADGSWMKRSYKFGKYDSSSGLGAIVGFRTKKVLFVGVRNKFCSICDPAQKKGVAPREHTCYKNWGRNVSSTSMEGDAILEGFKSSISQHGLIYSTLIADGDSSVYKKITDSNPYRDHDVYVKKVECGNHLARNAGTKVLEISRRKGIPGPLRRKIKDSVPRLCVAIRKAVQHRLAQNLSVTETNKMLKADILNIPSHIFGEHGKCADYFCTGAPKVNEENCVPELKALGLFDALEDTVSRLSHHTDSLLFDVNNNTVESFNNVVAKFIAGKHINFGKRNSYNARSLGSAVQYNSKKVLTRFREVMDKEPSQIASVMEANRARWAEMQQQRIARDKQSCAVRRVEPREQTAERRQQTVDKDYSPNAGKPDLSAEEYAVELDRHIARLKEYQQNLLSLERETVDQANSTRWLSVRQKLLTASKFDKVCLMRGDTSCKSTVQSILFANNLRKVAAVDYGRKNEQNARLELEIKENVQVEECGLFVDPEILGLGASPDGLIGDDGIVEIKCPYSARDLTPDEAIATKNISVRRIFKNIEGTEMNENHEYYYQIQGQLHITGRDYCLFMLWTPKGSKIIKVARDDEFWNDKMKPRLVQFYENCLIPEIVDSRYNRSMPIRDPPYIFEAQEVSAKRKRDREAKVAAKKRQTEVDEIDPC